MLFVPLVVLVVRLNTIMVDVLVPRIVIVNHVLLIVLLVLLHLCVIHVKLIIGLTVVAVSVQHVELAQLIIITLMVHVAARIVHARRVLYVSLDPLTLLLHAVSPLIQFAQHAPAAQRDNMMLVVKALKALSVQPVQRDVLPARDLQVVQRAQAVISFQAAFA